MREIKFRGLFNGVWWYVSPEDDEWEQFWTITDRQTVGQFTGLKDKTDKEIYEGDIVTSDHEDITPGYTWAVKWKDAGFSPFSDLEERGHGELEWYGVHTPLKTFEVISNIYEHPEMVDDE